MPQPCQPASQPWAPVGPKVPQVLQRGTLELKVRRLYYTEILLYAAPATRTPFGSHSGKVAPKRVLSAKTRFGVPKPLISHRKT